MLNHFNFSYLKSIHHNRLNQLWLPTPAGKGTSGFPRKRRHSRMRMLFLRRMLHIALLTATRTCPPSFPLLSHVSPSSDSRKSDKPQDGSCGAASLRSRCLSLSVHPNLGYAFSPPPRGGGEIHLAIPSRRRTFESPFNLLIMRQGEWPSLFLLFLHPPFFLPLFLCLSIYHRSSSETF